MKWRNESLFALGFVTSLCIASPLYAVDEGAKSPATSETSVAGKLKGKCMNIGGYGAHIVGRLGKGMYEVVWQTIPMVCESHRGCKFAFVSDSFPLEAQRSVLFTIGDKYESSGRIYPLWIDYVGPNERIELPTSDGFKKRYSVIRESVTCNSYGETLARAEEAKTKKKEAVQREQTARRVEDMKRRIFLEQAKKKEGLEEQQQKVEATLK